MKFSCYTTLSFCAGLLTLQMNAQARPAAVQPLRIQPFGMFSDVKPDFGTTGFDNKGFAAGVDITAFRLLPHLYPSLDLRAQGSYGDVSNQVFYGGGPRVFADLGRFQPYGSFLVGTGSIHFPHPASPTYTHDSSTVLAYGGGLDVLVTPYIAVRGEVLSQRWQLSNNTPDFHPTVVSVGIRYQLHSRGVGPGR